MPRMVGAEADRLREAIDGRSAWRRWGPYLSERQWGTVREDYSEDGSAWTYFPHDQARSRAYRWGEDGIGGLSDQIQRLCLSVALWNGKDPILKERLFGLTNLEGNHGEDIKELYYYLDATPTHSYLRMLYKYPQTEYPYLQLIQESTGRTRLDPEPELIDTGIFAEDRYFDIEIEYAKADVNDIILRITAHNRGPDPAPLWLLPQAWFRNRWSWSKGEVRPRLSASSADTVVIEHKTLGRFVLHCDAPERLLFTENETNVRRCTWLDGSPGFAKDAFHSLVVDGDESAVNPEAVGSKVAALHRFTVPSQQAVSVRMRLVADQGLEAPFADADEVIARRRAEADEFYACLQHHVNDADHRAIQRQALAGMIWSKQFYFFDVRQWLDGDESYPAPNRQVARNGEWRHLNNADIISMPDKWEYPWYAAWDLAFHCVPLAQVDAGFAKDQIVLLCREWYMHPNGQLPAYEWAFGDVNPPVHAWAAWRVFQIDRQQRGDSGDLGFLERVFHKLLLNFTWWVNRKDPEGRNIFQGGFLGLDNIGLFDRSKPLPTGGQLDQADGTAWVAMFSLNMMRIALELGQHNPVYQDVATKFFEHFLQIAEAMTNVGERHIPLWDDDDGFFYDVLHLPDGTVRPMRVRSIVGLIPLFAVEILDEELLERVPAFTSRLEWYLRHRPDLAQLVSRWQVPGRKGRHLLSLARRVRMTRILSRVLDPDEFLSPFGVRALSRHHADHPYVFEQDGICHEVRYVPGESDTGLFGGNSNWRGPIWLPLNYLLIESLRRYYHYYGPDLRIECPIGSGRLWTLREIAYELARRLIRLFAVDHEGCRPVHGPNPKLQLDPHFRQHLLFYEYFHGDTGVGLGASHQTGWTGLVAKLIDDLHNHSA